VNVTRGRLLAESAELASSPWARFRGLMGRSEVPAGSGLVLRPGGAIHTWFMRVPIDVLHLDGRGQVTHLLHGLRPWRFGPLLVGRWATVELPAGAAADTAIGDTIQLQPL
jgi:uncharacterized membrane protein (UPF0127 family)